jgi:hypothetical protein
MGSPNLIDYSLRLCTLCMIYCIISRYLLVYRFRKFADVILSAVPGVIRTPNLPLLVFSACGGTPFHWVLAIVDHRCMDVGIYDSLPELESVESAMPVSMHKTTIVMTKIDQQN